MTTRPIERPRFAWTMQDAEELAAAIAADVLETHREAVELARSAHVYSPELDAAIVEGRGLYVSRLAGPAAGETDPFDQAIRALLSPVYRCAGPSCPGLPYRASDVAHPASCAVELCVGFGGELCDKPREPGSLFCKACDVLERDADAAERGRA